MKKWLIGVGVVIVTLIAIIIIPIVINELYKANDGYITVWTGDDVLSFYGATIGAMGTIVLGVVAWAQNKRLLKLEETRYLIETRPFVLLTDWKIVKFDKDELLSNPTRPELYQAYVMLGEPKKINLALSITLSNTTNSFLTAEYIKCQYVTNSKALNWGRASIGTSNQKLRLSPNESGNISFLGTIGEFKESFGCDVIKISFVLENRIGDRYIEEFELLVQISDYVNPFGDPIVFIYSDQYQVRLEKTEENKVLDMKRKKQNGQTENAHAE